MCVCVRACVPIFFLPGICTWLFGATAVIVEVLFAVETRVHCTIECGSSPCDWLAANSCTNPGSGGSDGSVGGEREGSNYVLITFIIMLTFNSNSL